jgi:beta-N-acetylhexosaminidase
MSRKILYAMLIIIMSLFVFFIFKNTRIPDTYQSPSAPETDIEGDINEMEEENETSSEILSLIEEIYTDAEEGRIPQSPLVVGASSRKDVRSNYGDPDSLDENSELEYAVYLSENITVGYDQSISVDLRSYKPEIQEIVYTDITDVLGQPDDITPYEDSAHSQIIMTYLINENYTLKWVLDQYSEVEDHPKLDHISIKITDQHPTAVLSERIRNLTLEEKLGQMIFAGISGTAADERAMRLITEDKVGGIIFNGHNLISPDQTISYVNALKSANTENKVPLFFGVDQEGGRVSKLPGDLVKIPSSLKIGELNNPDFSFEIGKSLGELVKAYGFNIDFAPVLDINSNPNNPVIGDRSFGISPEIVSSLGIATMKGLQEVDIIPTIKHFPGHGDTSVDSHLALPVIEKSLEDLEELELIPFANAIEEGADMVMIAHLLLPEIDEDLPSSLSKTIISDLLREKLNYDGVVITDDMTMKAIDSNYGLDEAAVLSVQAGTDIVMVANDYDKIDSVLSALDGAVTSGEISVDRIDESVRRILLLKDKYMISDEQADAVTVNELNEQLQRVLNSYMN